MATAPPPQPPPLPPSCGGQPGTISPTPCPGHAALPYVNTPVQETSPSPETQHVVESAPAPPLLPVQSGPQSPPSQEHEDSPSDKEEKYSPVPETDPATQMTEQHDEAAVQIHPAGEDQSP